MFNNSKKLKEQLIKFSYKVVSSLYNKSDIKKMFYFMYQNKTIFLFIFFFIIIIIVIYYNYNFFYEDRLGLGIGLCSFFIKSYSLLLDFFLFYLVFKVYVTLFCCLFFRGELFNIFFFFYQILIKKKKVIYIKSFDILFFLVLVYLDLYICIYFFFEEYLIIVCTFFFYSISIYIIIYFFLTFFFFEKSERIIYINFYNIINKFYFFFNYFFFFLKVRFIKDKIEGKYLNDNDNLLEILNYFFINSYDFFPNIYYYYLDYAYEYNDLKLNLDNNRFFFLSFFFGFLLCNIFRNEFDIYHLSKKNLNFLNIENVNVFNNLLKNKDLNLIILNFFYNINFLDLSLNKNQKVIFQTFINLLKKKKTINIYTFQKKKKNRINYQLNYIILLEFFMYIYIIYIYIYQYYKHVFKYIYIFSSQKNETFLINNVKYKNIDFYGINDFSIKKYGIKKIIYYIYNFFFFKYKKSLFLKDDNFILYTVNIVLYYDKVYISNFFYKKKNLNFVNFVEVVKYVYLENKISKFYFFKLLNIFLNLKGFYIYSLFMKKKIKNNFYLNFYKFFSKFISLKKNLNFFLVDFLKKNIYKNWFIFFFKIIKKKNINIDFMEICVIEIKENKKELIFEFEKKKKKVINVNLYDFIVKLKNKLTLFLFFSTKLYVYMFLEIDSKLYLVFFIENKIFFVLINKKVLDDSDFFKKIVNE